MKTVIRLQNHGYKNHPYWWIVVMGGEKNPRGRFIEKVGYYIPRQCKTVNRSIILNKNRLRYWLAMGALPTEKVQLFLSYVDLMPAPLAKYGSGTKYDKPSKEVYEHPTMDTYRLGKSLGSNQIREQEEENILKQKLYAAQEMGYSAEFNQVKAQPNMNDIDDRTKEFYRLREELDNLQKNVSEYDESKKNLLVRRINELSLQGIKEKLKKTDQIYEFDEKQFQQVNQAQTDLKKKQLQYLKLLDSNQARVEQAKKDIEMLQPITRDEFMDYQRNHSKKKGFQIKRDADQIFKEANEKGSQVTKLDAIFYTRERNTSLNPIELTNEKTMKRYQSILESLDQFHYFEKFTFNQIQIDQKENVLIPSRVPIHPLPDIRNYDPEDYFNVSEIHGNSKLDSNQGYDLPNIDSTKIRKDYDTKRMKFSHKAKTGRKTPVRKLHFSTLNCQNISMNIDLYNKLSNSLEILIPLKMLK